MPSLTWYVNRLSRMSLPEILFRIYRTTHAMAEKAGFGLVTIPPAADSKRDRSASVPFGSAIHVPKGMYVSAADKIIAGRLTIFRLNNYQYGPDVQWNRDPLTGTDAPLIFGKTLDYRDSTLVGDIKYLWEPNRHLHLVTVAQAFRLTGDKKYLDFIVQSINSWIDQCPYPMGPNWCSSLELAIRLINWTLVWRIVGGEKPFLAYKDNGQCFTDNWLKSIYQHCHFIAGYYSQFSSANNHLIGEASGLYCAASIWNYWPACNSWADSARNILIDEASRQVTDDGVTKEQAIAYQQFVVDFLLISGLLGDQLSDPFPAEYWERIHSMTRFLGSVMDIGHNVPMLGDADDGFVFNLSPEPGFCPFRSLIATGASRFNDPYLKFKAGNFDQKSYWLLGEVGLNDFSRVAEDNTAVTNSFPAAGYYILGSNLDSYLEVRLFMDAGPLGMLPMAAHGHADALSLLLNVAGHEILIDPGTYAYHTKRKWRDYFRGTSAHNTVQIDGEDQSVPGGTFMWIKHTRSRCLSWEFSPTEDRLVAEHDGYSRLPDPVTHQREVAYDKVGHRIRVTDTIKSSTEHNVKLFWHISEHCTANLVERSVLIDSPGAAISIKCPNTDVKMKLFYGDDETPLGWVSRSFDTKIPTTTAVFSIKTKNGQSIETFIDIELKA